MELINKDKVVAEIERRIEEYQSTGDDYWFPVIENLKNILSFLDTLEVKDPYGQCVQYPSIKDGIEAHASIYSFNIESQLFPQLTKEQQALWRKEIEQAVISGGDAGYLLAKDPRYKENLEVKEVDVEKESELIANSIMISVQANLYHTNVYDYEKRCYKHSDLKDAAKKGFELGFKAKGE